MKRVVVRRHVLDESGPFLILSSRSGGGNGGHSGSLVCFGNKRLYISGEETRFSTGTSQQTGSQESIRRRSMRRFLLFLLLSILVGCDPFGGNSSDDSGACVTRRLIGQQCYPATLPALSEEERTERIHSFRRESDGEICSTLDVFGFTSGDGCVGPQDIPDDTLEREEALEKAKMEIAAYEEFTNVHSASALEVEQASPSGEGRLWRVIFQAQTFSGFRVRDTGIYAWLTADGIYRLDQHWYQGIVFPVEQISREEALQQVIGHEIGYSDWTGAQTLNVSEENLPPSDSVEMGILPHRVESELRLHVVWEVEVADSFFRLYVDAARGTVLDHAQLVMF